MLFDIVIIIKKYQTSFLYEVKLFGNTMFFVFYQLGVSKNKDLALGKRANL
jgi:hypothetical protein